MATRCELISVITNCLLPLSHIFYWVWWMWSLPQPQLYLYLYHHTIVTYQPIAHQLGCPCLVIRYLFFICNQSQIQTQFDLFSWDFKFVDPMIPVSESVGVWAPEWHDKCQCSQCCVQARACWPAPRARPSSLAVADCSLGVISLRKGPGPGPGSCWPALYTTQAAGVVKLSGVWWQCDDATWGRVQCSVHHLWGSAGL